MAFENCSLLLASEPLSAVTALRLCGSHWHKPFRACTRRGDRAEILHVVRKKSNQLLVWALNKFTGIQAGLFLAYRLQEVPLSN